MCVESGGNPAAHALWKTRQYLAGLPFLGKFGEHAGAGAGHARIAKGGQPIEVSGNLGKMATAA